MTNTAAEPIPFSMTCTLRFGTTIHDTIFASTLDEAKVIMGQVAWSRGYNVKSITGTPRQNAV